MTEMAMLPAEFSTLEPYAERWCLATENERWNERLASPMEDLQALYDACFPHVTAAIAHCDKYPLHDMPTDAVNLLHLVYSFIIVSFPVELWGQPQVPDTAGTAFMRIVEPTP
jgi:hypothetical protein